MLFIDAESGISKKKKLKNYKYWAYTCLVSGQKILVIDTLDSEISIKTFQTKQFLDKNMP